MNNKAKAHYRAHKHLLAMVRSVIFDMCAATVRITMLLYHAFTSSNCTSTHRLAIYGAFVYLFIPADLLHDLTPTLGYIDDGLLIIAAVVSLFSCMDLNIRIKAKNKTTKLMEKWFHTSAL
ncbi:YkvA family protein [Pseudoalteromonas pernae]|uniref:YkvA family protein n=1 Tax=Pseudoalteromonas pernae TaxID=3118054 RepID=UPI003242DAEA